MPGIIIEPLVQIGPYGAVFPGANDPEAPLPYFVTGVNLGVVPTGGRIFGIGCSMDEAVTAGQLLLRPTDSNGVIGPQLVMPVGPLFAFLRSPDGQTFVAGEGLGVNLETVGLAPVAALVLTVTLFVVLNRGVSTDAGGI